ncbi:NYN domain-containing protein [Olivibacter sp. SDN3]|uniref:NYN domain-containing protein n=1 Tax=Olivibacter sp. SDN3 TaxID=2764720 RepID=UPI0016516236|nr:NYN domain-containing protein [Olivibacter sp. SDN3]QNL50215.1 NYN domain-containing protein [Olivibacter sp. SDN3]
MGITKENPDLNIAVLIDADNVSSTKIEGILDEVKRHGTPSIKRIYGDWTSAYVSGWKAPLLTHAITPIQQYSYTSGKNSTDSALIIDAMDILHTQQIDGFCIVSSDSDFTRLAIRLRESGKVVLGIGQKKTPKPFIAACDKFIYIEILGDGRNETAAASTEIPEKDKDSDHIEKGTLRPTDTETISNNFIKLLRNTIDDVADESGWASLAELGALLNKRKPDFDPRIYGFSKLTPFFKSLSKHFDIEEKNVENSKIKHVYIKNKESKKPIRIKRKLSNK